MSYLIDLDSGEAWDYDDDDWKYEDLHHVPEEPDYCCWNCSDTGTVVGRGRIPAELNCPTCRPTPRQRRRHPLQDAWWARKWDREADRRPDALIDLGAPF